MSTMGLDARIAEMRSSVYHAQYSVTTQQGLVANDQRQELFLMVERVLELHERSFDEYTDPHGIEYTGEHCAECRSEWPCSTVEALIDPGSKP